MRLYGWLGFLLLLVSEYCLFRKIEPFHSWFYCFAWWAYILLADNLLLRLRGRSLLTGRGMELWRMLPFSVLVWVVFEAYNLVLKNWAYEGVPAEPWLRWPGYAVAFATVIPGIFITADILEHVLLPNFRPPTSDLRPPTGLKETGDRRQKTEWEGLQDRENSGEALGVRREAPPLGLTDPSGQQCGASSRTPWRFQRKSFSCVPGCATAQARLFGSSHPPFASEAEVLTTPARRISSPLSVLIGILLCAAPLFWPRYFFPAVWLGPIFLLDPFLERMGVQSLGRQFAARDRRRIYSLLAAGMACGLMWEFWNFWAPSRWIYDVPFVGKWKVFEMPVLGFLGFPPFALECWILYHLLTQGCRRLHSTTARVAFWLGIALICSLVFRAMDQYTVLRFI